MEQDLAIIVDGSYFVHRAWHIVHPLAHNQSVCKTPTNVVHGFLRAFGSLIQRFEPKYVSVVFDSPEPTFRHVLHDGYKANRPEHPKDLLKQLEFLTRLLPAMGYTTSIHPGIEGDDIIGTLAVKFEELGHRVIIATGDKDITQVVTENIRIEKNQASPLMTVDGVIEKFGVRPNQIAHYLALMGDVVDGISGVPGFGAKTAAKWINNWGDINGIKDAFEHGVMSIKEASMIKDHIDRLDLNLKLTTIVTTEELGFEESAFVVMPRNTKEVAVIAKELNMSYQINQY